MGDKLFIGLVGFNIELTFKPSSFPFLKERVKSEIISAWGSCILKEKPDQIDFGVEFTDLTELKGIQVFKDTFHYIILSKTTDKKVIQTYYQISRYQFTVIIQNILHSLIDKNKGFFLHSSSSCYKDKSFIFVGKSGAGKSTSANFLDKKFPRLTDDISFIRYLNGQFLCYQNPIFEKNDHEKKLKRILGGYKIFKIFFLKKSSEFKIKKMNRDMALENLTKQLINPSPMRLKNLMAFVGKLDNFYILYFKKDREKMVDFFQKISFDGNI